MANPLNPNATPATTLKGRDLQIFSLHMLGKSNLEIAKDLDIHPQTVANTMQTAYFRDAKQKVFADTMDAITKNTAGAFSPLTLAKAAAGRAMQIQVGLMENSKNETIKLNAVHDILDRVMGRPTQKITVEDEVDSIIEKMNDIEMEAYITKGEIPQWAADLGLTSGKPGASTVH